jgi:type I restriction enzyme M protein
VKRGLLRENGEPATLFSGPALVVAMDGSSGNVQVIDSGEFYCNHHGAVLTPKSNNINLWCVAQLIEPRLRGMASNQGSSATLTMPQLTEMVISYVPLAVAKKIEQSRKTLTTLAKLLA